MRTKTIAGNWKMHTNGAEAKRLATAIAQGVGQETESVAICPPFPYLKVVGESLRGGRGAAMSAVTVTNWALNLVVAVTFLTLVGVLGHAGTFWV
jgi:triosephosphate isomerase